MTDDIARRHQAIAATRRPRPSLPARIRERIAYRLWHWRCL